MAHYAGIRSKIMCEFSIDLPELAHNCIEKYPYSARQYGSQNRSTHKSDVDPTLQEKQKLHTNNGIHEPQLRRSMQEIHRTATRLQRSVVQTDAPEHLAHYLEAPNTKTNAIFGENLH